MNERIKPTYIDLRTDFGMKYVFQHERILRTLLNRVLERGNESFSIKKLKYENTETLGVSEDDRRVIFDLLCTTDDGRKIIVEMQIAKQINIRDRLLYYLTRMIANQGHRGNDWQYELYPVYVFAIFDFKLNDSETYFHLIELVDRYTNEVFSEKQKLYIIELPKFKSKPVTAYDPLDKWIYAFCNLGGITKRPDFMSEIEFNDLFTISQFANMTQEEEDIYFRILDKQKEMELVVLEAKREAKKEMELVVLEAKKEAKEEGQSEIIRNLISSGLPIEKIAELTKLPIEQIQKLM